MKSIFSKQNKEKASEILKSPLIKLTDLNSNEIKELAVAWCYYSGKIEGNTYTYVETEALLKDGVTSEKRYEDAKMLKNLHNTFIAELEYIHKRGHIETIDDKTLFRIHKSIISSLVSDEESGFIRTRPVRISGTEYTPPKDIIEIKLRLNEIFIEQNEYENPLERAIFVHCNVAKLQPFIDGNKRTARMMESIVLMNANIIPVYSLKDADILHYRRGLVDFYETGDYEPYSDYFIERMYDKLRY